MGLDGPGRLRPPGPAVPPSPVATMIGGAVPGAPGMGADPLAGLMGAIPPEYQQLLGTLGQAPAGEEVPSISAADRIVGLLLGAAGGVLGQPGLGYEALHAIMQRAEEARARNETRRQAWLQSVLGIGGGGIQLGEQREERAAEQRRWEEEEKRRGGEAKAREAYYGRMAGAAETRARRPVQARAEKPHPAERDLVKGEMAKWGQFSGMLSDLTRYLHEKRPDWKKGLEQGQVKTAEGVADIPGFRDPEEMRQYYYRQARLVASGSPNLEAAFRAEFDDIVGPYLPGPPEPPPEAPSGPAGPPTLGLGLGSLGPPSPSPEELERRRSGWRREMQRLAPKR